MLVDHTRVGTKTESTPWPAKEAQVPVNSCIRNLTIISKTDVLKNQDINTNNLHH